MREQKRESKLCQHSKTRWTLTRRVPALAAAARTRALSNLLDKEDEGGAQRLYRRPVGDVHTPRQISMSFAKDHLFSSFSVSGKEDLEAIAERLRKNLGIPVAETLCAFSLKRKWTLLREEGKRVYRPTGEKESSRKCAGNGVGEHLSHVPNERRLGKLPPQPIA